MLGLSEYRGMGREINQGAARVWFLKSALLGYANAQFMYAYMLQSGDGGESEPSTAMVWSSIAGRNGKSGAAAISSMSAQLMTDAQLNDVEAMIEQCLNTNYADCPQ
ncbi:MAG: hypothetical protein HN817_04265 [Porticoccaceae bacterium]|nr:hypothetical protein [Porticoccaceae bacterium]